MLVLLMGFKYFVTPAGLDVGQSGSPGVKSFQSSSLRFDVSSVAFYFFLDPCSPWGSCAIQCFEIVALFCVFPSGPNPTPLSRILRRRYSGQFRKIVWRR